MHAQQMSVLLLKAAHCREWVKTHFVLRQMVSLLSAVKYRAICLVMIS